MEKVHEAFMREALKEARKAFEGDEVPVGAVIVKDGEIIARGRNRRESLQDATAHAEIIAIKEACERLKSWRLSGCTLYVTLEPCPMCAGAVILSRIDRVVFGAYDPKSGCAGSVMDLFSCDKFNHHPEIIGGVLEEECARLLKEFFKKKRI
ncbi:MAG: tRNA adenosine(34) deaminase TadA [Thermovenabulum sp.]|uniref:tRNA adenosine(34) deaminase TadA n=1 Tax=Thermovenabulum sp. TaxID=3100335 RepID=UPI003C7A5EF6